MSNVLSDQSLEPTTDPIDETEAMEGIPQLINKSLDCDDGSRKMRRQTRQESIIVFEAFTDISSEEEPSVQRLGRPQPRQGVLDDRTRDGPAGVGEDQYYSGIMDPG